MITELRLRNFKCFAELDLPLAPLTLLSGVNSTGKSSVLQSLLLLRQSHRVGILKQGLALNGALVRLGTADMVVRENEARIEIAIDWDDGGTAGFAYDLRPIGEKSEFVADRIPDNHEYESRQPFTSCGYVSADRLGPRATYPMSDEAADASDVGPRGEFTSHLLAAREGKVISLPELHHEKARSPALKEEVEAWLGLLAPGVRIEPRVMPELDLCSLEFTFPGPAGPSDPRRSTHVGFGLTYALPILAAVLSARRGDLLMIENPEAHLHPRAQRGISELLARAAAADVQVLVETHSDHVLNGARVAVKRGVLKPEDVKAHFFAGPDRPVRSPEISAGGVIVEWPDGFFDEWDRALEDLL